ncbi:MAG: hypothetical protein K2N01_09955 [Lachnospiraceae bacterium]|nr:hypothetical protein [Lachnospiraceae bacterium]
MQKIGFVLDLVKVSYEQEMDRLKRINQKADNLTKYISIYLVMLNLVVPLIIKKNIALMLSPWICYLLAVVPAVVSLIIAVATQALDKVTLFPMGYSLENDIIDNPKEYDSDIKLESKQIALYDDAIMEIEKNNDLKIRYIIGGYVFYSIAVIALAVIVLDVLLLLQ